LAKRFLIAGRVVSLQSSAMKCTGDNIILLHTGNILQQSAICHDNRLSNELLSVVVLACIDDAHIRKLYLGGIFGWANHNLFVPEKCCVLRVSNTPISDSRIFQFF
jgi:hypothetical protein